MDPKGYNVALERALEALDGIDIASQMSLCGGTYEEDSRIARIRFFNEDYALKFPDGEIVEGSDILVRRLILLHYISRSDGTAPSGKMVTFREVPEGNFYFHSFRDRVINPILRDYGNDGRVFAARLENAGWQKEGEGGDVSYRIVALPLVSVQAVLWLGDEELAPEASMLFDSNISHHLHTEDIALLGEVALSTLQS